MATPSLPSTNSIVDYLKSQGKDSSFSSRKKMYNDLGLNSRLGEFVGSASQNLNLLKQIQTKPAPTPAPTKMPEFSVTGGGVPVFNPGATQTTTPAMSTKSRIQQPSPTSPAPALSFSPTMPSANPAMDFLGRTQTSTPAVASSVLQQAGVPAYNQPAPAPKATPTQTTQKTTTQAPQTPSVQQPSTPKVQASQQRDTTVKQTTGGISASTLYPDIFDNDEPSEAELVNSWLDSAEGKIFLERQNLAGMNAEAKAEAAKQELEAKYKSEKKTLEQNLSEAGLAFSGIRGSKVKALADSLAASTLDVDREFASKLLDANVDLREAIIKGVAELAKQAKDNRKEAIQQLNAIGYAVVGNQLVPTLSAQREERALRAEERSEKQLEMSERRLLLAEESSARAEARFEELYGKEKINGFKAAQELITLNPTATEADIRSTIRSNPEIFGDMTEAEINDAVKLVGIPPTLQATIVDSYIEQFDGLFSSKTEAKKKAKEALQAGGGVINIDMDGKTKTYVLTTDQLNDLLRQVDEA